MAIGELAQQFLEENAVADDPKSAHLSQKNYMEFAKQQGFNADMVNKFSEMHAELLNGMYRYVNNMNVKAVKSAQKNHEDPTKVKVALSCNIPGGSIVVSQVPTKSYPIPNKPGETTTKFNVTTCDIRQTRHFDKEMLRTCEDEMKALLKM